MQKWLVDLVGDEISSNWPHRSGEKEDDDVKMILAVQQVDIINDVSIVQSSLQSYDGHDK